MRASSSRPGRSGTTSVSLALAVTGLAAFVLLANSVPAQAATKCKLGRYSEEASGDVYAEQLDVAGMPRLTSHYAPRCLVAKTLAGSLTYNLDHHGQLPMQVHLRGARWDAGTSRVRSVHLVDTDAHPYESVTARHGRGRITLIVDDITASAEYPVVKWTSPTPVRAVVSECDPANSTSQAEPGGGCSEIVNYDVVANVANREEAHLVALRITRDGDYLPPPWIMQLVYQADQLNVAPRYAIIRWPGREIHQVWQSCGACSPARPAI